MPHGVSTEEWCRYFLSFSLHFGIRLLQVYVSIQAFSLLLIHLVHLIMYNPDDKCNKGFPFHATVSQLIDGDAKKAETTTISVKGVAADGEAVEKIVKMGREDFQMLINYSLRIQVC